MPPSPAGRSLDWGGGSLDELLGILAEPALSARVEARRHDGIGDRVVGEVHVVAGGYADAFAGTARGDAAMAKLRDLKELKFRVEPRLPHPVTGNLSPPGLEEGSLAERPLPDLMRYCEDYVLTCTVEVVLDAKNARVSYRRGELVKTTVNGVESDTDLPDVLGWSEGTYRFALPQLVLPERTRIETVEFGSLEAAAALAAAPAVAPAPSSVPAAAPPPSGPVAPAPQAPHQNRSTIPFLPAAEPGNAAARATHPGMPVDIFDKPQDIRNTEVGVPAVSTGTPATKQTLPAAGGGSKRPSEPKTDGSRGDARSTQPGFASTQARMAAEPDEAPVKKGKKKKAIVPVAKAPITAPPPDPEPPRAAGSAAKPGTGKKSLYDLPLGIHVALGLGLGGAVVILYWLLNQSGR